VDESRFDDLSRRMALATNRRSVLRGLVGGGAAIVASRAGTTLAAPADKVTICHFTGDPDNPYTIIEVSGNALPDHTEHGDFVYLGQCCLDSECVDTDACTINEACSEGACTSDELDCAELVDDCNEGLCDPATGCYSSPTNEEEPCEDGTGACQEGARAVACTAGQDFCTQTIEGLSCGNSPSCYCASNPVSGTFCGQLTSLDCANYQPCGIDGSCPEGQLCAIGEPACCDGGMCLAPCD